MKNDTPLSLIRTLFSSFPSKLLIAQTALEQLKLCEDLSPAGFLSVKTIHSCHSHMNHACQLIDYLTKSETLPELFQTSSFDSEQLMSEITSAFSKAILGFSTVTAQFCSKLERPFPIYVNKTKFETVILNLLYCFMKTDNTEENKKTKIILSVSETKKNIVFHVRTNTIPQNAEKLEQLINNPRSNLADAYAEDTILALSLEVASKFVQESEGKLSYKTLKSSSRFDISLPKLSSLSTSTMHSSQPYSPNWTNFKETFADIELMYLMQTKLNDLLDT